jgi:uncharacterized membrane protein
MRTNRLIHWSLVTCAIAALAAPCSAQILDTGVDGGAYGITNDGTVFGRVLVGNHSQAFTWRRQVGVTLLPDLGANSVAIAMNDNGWVVGQATEVDGAGQIFVRAALWRNGVLTILTPGFPADTQAEADVVTNSGLVLGTYHSPTLSRMFMWSESSGFVDVRPDLILYPSQANATGTVAGTEWFSGCPSPILWDVATGISFPAPEVALGQAVSVNADKTVLIQSYPTCQIDWHTWEYLLASADGTRTLVPRPDGYGYFLAVALSDWGDIAGVADPLSTPDGNNWPFVFQQGVFQ